MKRRILAIFMMVAMIITMVPVVALAEDEPVLPTLLPGSEVYEVIENTGGAYVTEGSQTYYKYSYPTNAKLIDQDINVGMAIWNYYSQGFIWTHNDIMYSLQSDIDEIQSIENQWGINEDGYKVTFYWVNTVTGEPVKEATSFKIKVVENPVTDVTYDTDTVNAFAYANGRYEKDETGKIQFVYELDSIKPSLTGVSSNGDVVTVSDDGSCLVFNNEWYPTEVIVNQSLAPGENSVIIDAMGIKKEYTINLKSPGMKERVDYIEVLNIEFEEGTNYNLYPKFVVHYKDGTVGYSSDAEYDPWWYSYTDAIDKVDYSVGVFFDVDQSEWVAGSTYNGKMYFLGDEYDFNVTITPSEVDKIETNSDMDVPESESQYITNALECNIEQLPITITYKDGESETKLYKDIDGISYYGGFYYSPVNVGDTCDVVISYKGATTNVTAKLIAPEISSVEIDESSIGRMYYNPNPLQGDPGYSWAASTGVKGKINYSDGDSEIITFDYDGKKYVSHDGKEYVVCLDSEGNANENNVKYKMSVGNIFDYADIEVVDSSVVVASVECLSEPTKKYYIDDSFYSDCKANFDPHIFEGLRIKVTMTNGDVIILSGDDLHRKSFYDGTDFYEDGGFSKNLFFIVGDRNATKTSADLYANILGNEYYICEMTRTESPYESLEIIDKLSDEQVSNFDGSGLKFKLTYKDGTEKEITLGTPLKGSNGFGCTVSGGGYDLDHGALGDGGYYTPGYDNSISGIKYNVWDISEIVGEEEYATIVWNNGVLRLSNLMVVIDPDKYNTTSGNTDVVIDTASLSEAAIDSLGLDDRFAVEQQGVSLYTSVNVDEVSPSSKITVKAKGDDADIKSCFDINFSYLVLGNEYQLTELPNGKIAVTIPLDESLWGAAKEDIVIYREHEYADGVKVEQITDFTISDDGKYITFESDKFSTFAIGIAEDETTGGGNGNGGNGSGNVAPKGGDGSVAEQIANTLDNSPIGGTIALMMSSGLCAYAVIKKRREIA